jgi:hypothetical protein
MTEETATWQRFTDDDAELAGRVLARFEANKHHILATLRRDGAPRVSGTEVQFVDGDLYAGMMTGSIKGRDLRRDARFALHSHPGDSSMAGGDAKLAGRAALVTDPAAIQRYTGEVGPPPDFDLFRLELSEVVVTSLHPDGDRLVIETWTPARPRRRVERE